MLLVDTPGIVHVKASSPEFKLQAALANLIDQRNVALPELFAFALYVLAQKPNMPALKQTLARDLPDTQGRQQGAIDYRAGPEVSLQDAYAARRVAKCVLQAIAEAEQQQHAWPASAAAHECSEGGRFSRTQPGHDRWQPAGSSEAPQNADAVREMRHAATRAQSMHSCNEHVQHRASTSKLAERLRKPRRAHELLEAMGMQQLSAEIQNSGQPAAARHTQPLGIDRNLEPEDKKRDSTAARHTPEACGYIAADVHIRKGQWDAFDLQQWQYCSELVLQKLLNKHQASDTAAVNAAMERVLRLLRQGALGQLMFQDVPSQRKQGQGG